MHVTVIRHCCLVSHDSAENDSTVSTSMKGNCATMAASVIKGRSYTVYIMKNPQRGHRRERSRAVHNGGKWHRTVENRVILQ